MGKAGNSSGGGHPSGVDAGALKLLITGGGLKRDMVNYLKSIQIDKVQNPQVKSSLERMMVGDRLVKDILTPNNFFLATKTRPCLDEYNNKVPASTIIGDVGGPVCFNIDKLVSAYKDLSEEAATIHLAALAFHEFTHHYQMPSADPQIIQSNEVEANRVGGYVLLTAKFLMIPVLQWTPNDQGNGLFQQIQKMYDEIRAKERKFLAVPGAYYAKYPGFKNQPDRGLFRLLPREIYEGKLSIEGGGAYYSFSTKSHDYQSIAELELDQGELSTGFAGCDFGYIVKIGSIPLNEVNETTPALAYLLNFIPASKDVPAVRKQQSQAINSGVHTNGYFYLNSTQKPLAVGQTYALRAISYDYADVLVVFRIIDIEKDGSLIIVWKKIKSFPALQCGSDGS